jgi:hypothetical protein
MAPEQVRGAEADARTDLVSHLSCLYDQRVTDDLTVRRQFFEMSEHRLTAFVGYVASVNPRTKFLVYSRGRFGTDEATWISNVVARFPQMRGRLHTMVVPGGEKATFRDPATMQQVHARVAEILGLD